MRRRLGSLPLAILLVAALGACSSDDGDEGGAAVPRASTTTASTTSTTTAEQAYAIPDTIDAAYVNRVMTALNKVYGDVVRKQAETRQIVEADLVPLRAIFNDPEFAEQAEVIARTPARPAEEYQSPIGDRRSTIVRIIAANPNCISFEARMDYSPIVKTAPPPSTGWFTLQRRQQGADPAGLNPTPWAISSHSLSEEDGCADS